MLGPGAVGEPGFALEEGEPPQEPIELVAVLHSCRLGILTAPADPSPIGAVLDVTGVGGRNNVLLGLRGGPAQGIAGHALELLPPGARSAGIAGRGRSFARGIKAGQ